MKELIFFSHVNKAMLPLKIIRYRSCFILTIKDGTPIQLTDGDFLSCYNKKYDAQYMLDILTKYIKRK